ncbi:MAG: hypothetical protein MJZ19_03165 [Paludibacteraceae bacterium]|nr:hypothetical protein [Paludibacteraceae bacterium]
MRTLLQKTAFTALAMLGISQASAITHDVRVGEKYLTRELFKNDFFYNRLNGDSVDIKTVLDNGGKLVAWNPEVADLVDDDTIVVNAKYYDGQGQYFDNWATFGIVYPDFGNEVFDTVNVKVAPEARLSEAKTYTNPTDLQMESIEFTRTFSEKNVNTWQTIYLPFSIDIKAHAADFYVARLYGRDYVEDTNGDGIVGYGDDKWVIQKYETSGFTRANEPLLVSPKHAGEITFRAADNILAAAKNDTIRMADTIFSAADKVYEIVCSYDINVLAPNDNNYYVGASGALSYRTTSANYIPYRWYYHTDSKVDSVYVKPSEGGMRQYVIVDTKFETAKPINTVEVYAGEIFDAEKFCYYVNCAPFAPLSSIESSDETVAWIESGVFHAAEFAYDGHGKISDSNRSCKLALRTEYGSVTVVNLVVKPNTAKLSEAKTYTNPDSLQLDGVEFARTFSEKNVNTWQTIYLPFAIDIKEHSKDFYVARLFGYGPVEDTNGDGVVNDDDDLWIVQKFASSGVTNPNEPLLVSPKYAGEITFRAADNVIVPAKNDTVVVKDSSDRTYEIVCTYDINVLAPNDNNYYVGASGALSYRTTSANYIPYRWYYHTDSKFDSVYVKPSEGGLRQYVVVDESFEFPKADTIPVIGDDTTDVPGGDTTIVASIKLIECDNISEPEIYNVNGVKVKSLDNAPAGIYIVNRKKVLINKNK